MGLDVGETETHVCALRRDGTCELQTQTLSNVDEIVTALALLEDNAPVIAMEAGMGRNLALGLRDRGYEVRVIETRKARKFLSIRFHKTDRNDARGLAELAMSGVGVGPLVHIKSARVQLLRSQLVQRDLVTKQKNALQNAIRSRLVDHGIMTKMPPPTQFRVEIEKAIEDYSVISAVDLRPEILPLLEIWELMRKHINEASRRLEQAAKGDRTMSKFLGVPGIGPICAVSFYTAIEDPMRFARASDAGPYFGLVPKVMQSGANTRRGGISKAGSRLTRTHLVMAARVILSRAKMQCELRDWSRALAERIGHSKARVAVARKLAVVLLSMWKADVEFEPYPIRSPSGSGRLGPRPHVESNDSGSGAGAKSVEIVQCLSAG